MLARFNEIPDRQPDTPENALTVLDSESLDGPTLDMVEAGAEPIVFGTPRGGSGGEEGDAEVSIEDGAPRDVPTPARATGDGAGSRSRSEEGRRRLGREQRAAVRASRDVAAKQRDENAKALENARPRWLRPQQICKNPRRLDTLVLRH